MAILITGATGLIGSKLSERLIRDGYTVHFLTTSKKKIKNETHYKGFYWNPSVGEIDQNAFKDVTVIINLVGATIAKRWTSSYKKVILDSRVQTANLIYSTLENLDHQVRSFISSSGVSIYPNSKTKLYTEESTEVDDGFLADVVVAWEAAADQFKALGIDVAKIRTGVVFDTKEGAFPKLVKPVRMGIPSPVGSGEQWLSWIHINDIVGIYKYVLDKELEGVFNAVAPTPIKNKKLMKLISLRYCVVMWLPNIPSFMLKFILGEMAQLVLEGQLVSATKIEKHGYIFEFANAEKAIEDLLR
jgi:hypothetical protein